MIAGIKWQCILSLWIIHASHDLIARWFQCAFNFNEIFVKKKSKQNQKVSIRDDRLFVGEVIAGVEVTQHITSDIVTTILDTITEKRTICCKQNSDTNRCMKQLQRKFSKFLTFGRNFFVYENVEIKLRDFLTVIYDN